MAETVKGLNIKLSLDGEDLDNQLKLINKDLREQQKDLRAINTNLRYDSSNLDLWKKKQIQLNEVIEQTKKRLETQQKQLEQARVGLKLGTTSETEFRKLQRNVTYNQADLKKMNNELEQTKDKIKTIGNLKFDNLAKVGSTLTKSLTVPILGAVAALTAFAKKGIDTADSIGNTAKSLRMSAESLQEWNHVANMSGVETQTLEKAFEKVNQVVADIALGDVNSFAGVFHALGISMDEIEGKDTSDAFIIIRNALEKVEDESLRVAFANSLFGDNIGSDLLPMLGLEEQAINDLRKEAINLGIITESQIDTVGGYKDSMDKLKQSTTALSVEVAEVMIPIMQVLVDIFQEHVIPVFRSAVEWWKGLSEETKKLVLIITGFVAAIGPVLSIVAKVGPLINIVAVAFKALGTAGIFAGVGINAATLGLGALIAILAVALFQNEKFKELLGKLMEAFMKLLDPIIQIVEVLMDALMPILDIVIDIVTKLIDILMPIIDIILLPIIKQLEFLGGIFEMLSPLIQMVGNILQKVLVPAFKILEKILNPIMNILEKIIGLFQKVFDFAGNIGDVVGGSLGGITEVVEGAVGGIGDFVGNINGKVGDFAKGVVDKVSGNVNGIIDGVKSVATGDNNIVSNLTGKITSNISDISSKAKDKVSGTLKDIGNFFGDELNLKSNSKNNTNTTTNHATNNNITINTTSSDFNIDSINRALGGKFI